jgi:antitoxin component YwqK of YwqJK toxin-antitoxin module
MKKRILFILLILTSFIGQSQNSNENILYIVDGIPIIENPDKDDDELTESDIELLTVITDKNEISKYTNMNVDKVINIVTKPYAKRSEEIKAIPTTKLMTKKNGTWYLKNETKPYTGPFIDYYSTGKIRGDGTFFNGKLKGIRKMYYSNGNLSLERYYENGISHGIEKEYYENGILEQKGEFKNGKEIGIWEMYYPNKQLKQRANFNSNGKMDGEVISYYSTGKIKGVSQYKNGEYLKDKVNTKIFNYYNQSQELYKQGSYKSSIKKLTKAIELDTTWAKGYFARGTMKLNNFQFDEAIVDFNKTLEIEPYYTNAYSNRAFAIIRKYQFSNSRTLSKSKYVQVVASKETEIPENELKKICKDLNKAVSLGDKNEMILEALEKYCRK